MTKRDRLGRGLGALLAEYAPEKATDGVQARMVQVASIAPNPFQPRREFSEEELADLVSSIRENGLLQPIVVRSAPGGGGKWQLVAGERRWRAVTRLGWKEVPAVVKDVDDRTLLILAMVENLQRSQLSPLEEAEGYKRLADEFSLTQQQIAEVMGRDRSTIANAMRLLTLPISVRQLLSAGSLSAGHARALLGLGNERQMAELGREAAEQGWSVRELEARVQRVRPAKAARPRPDTARDVNERLLEEELQQVFGTQVRIRKGRGMKGRIEIPFLGADDFERVFELLVGRGAADVIS
jgi:ParB family chromosome partitioning protein